MDFLAGIVMMLKLGSTISLSILTVLFLAVFSLGEVFAQCINYNDYLHWVSSVESAGTLDKMMISGDYCFASDSEEGLLVYDLNQPGQPVAVGGLDVPTDSGSMAVSGQYLYYGQKQGYPSNQRKFLVIDVSIPSLPSLVESLDLPDGPRDISLSGNYAFVTTGSSGLQVVDISDPSSPGIVAQLAAGGYYQNSVIDGDYLYVLNSNSGLLVFDISNPLEPLLVGNDDFDSIYDELLISGNYAYVTTINSFHVVDITNPSNPQKISSLAIPNGDYTSTPRDMVHRDNFIFVGTSNVGLQVIDVSNPMEPFIAGGFSTPDGIRGMVACENKFYIGQESGGFEVIDASNPLSPDLLANPENHFTPEDIVVAGDYLCAATGYGGFRVVDISNPREPEFLTQYSSLEYTVAVGVSGNFAYVGERDGELVVINISDPTNPTLAGYKTINGGVKDIAVADDLLFVTTSNNESYGMTVYSLAAPGNPWFRSIMSFPASFYASLRIAVSGDVACVAQDEWLQVLDITNSAYPDLAHSQYISGGIYDVAMLDNYAIVSAGNSRLMVFDVSNPQSPVLESSIDLYGGSGEISMNGHYANVLTSSGGVQVVDVSNPQNPVHVGSLPRWSGGGCIASNDENIFFTGNDSYLSVFPAACSVVSSVPVVGPRSGGPVLIGNYPNPFNPSTSISYWLPKEAAVSLDVYDLGGHFITAIIKGEVISSGSHTALWDGRDRSGALTASGVYLYRLNVDGSSDSGRMVLVK